MSNIKNKMAIGDKIVGSCDSADIMYDETTSIKEKLDEQISNLPFKLGIDSAGNYGYFKDGADTVTPFKQEGVVYVGEGAFSVTIPFDGKARVVNQLSFQDVTLDGTQISRSTSIGGGEQGWEFRTTAEFTVKKGQTLAIAGTYGGYMVAIY